MERLRGTPVRVEELVRSFQSKILTVRLDGRWSIQEHVCHLLDLDKLHEGRLEDYLANATKLRPADMENKKTFQAGHNAKPILGLLTSFREARTHFVRRLEKFDEEMLGRTALHPRLQKRMRVVDFAYFVAEHDDHHLASMTELSKILTKQK